MRMSLACPLLVCCLARSATWMHCQIEAGHLYKVRLFSSHLSLILFTCLCTIDLGFALFNSSVLISKTQAGHLNFITFISIFLKFEAAANLFIIYSAGRYDLLTTRQPRPS